MIANPGQRVGGFQIPASWVLEELCTMCGKRSLPFINDTKYLPSYLPSTSRLPGSHITQTSSFSDALAAAVKNSCGALYALLGLCINKFSDNPTLIEPVFDLQSIRNHKQLKYTGALAGNEMESILQHTFSSADELKLESGLTAIQFYLSASAADTAANQTLITVNANTIITVMAAQFVNPAPAAGQPIANTFLHVVNTEAAAGSYKVSLL